MMETKLITSKVILETNSITITLEDGRSITLLKEEVIKLKDIIKIWQSAKVTC